MSSLSNGEPSRDTLRRVNGRPTTPLMVASSGTATPTLTPRLTPTPTSMPTPVSTSNGSGYRQNNRNRSSNSPVLNRENNDSYQCQRCNQSMVIHDSLKDLTFNQYQMLHNLSNDYKSNEVDDGRMAKLSLGEPGINYTGRDRRASSYLDQINEILSNQEEEGGDSTVMKTDSITTKTSPAVTPIPLVSHSPLAVPKVIGSNDTSNNSSVGESSYVMLTESQLSPPPPRTTAVTAGKRTGSARRENSESRNQPMNRGNAPAHTSTPEYYQPSTRLINLDNLFSILSDNSSNINYPICVNCCDLITDGLKLKFNNALKEKDMFVRFLNKVNQEISDDQDATATTATAYTNTKDHTSEVAQLQQDIASIRQTTEQDLVQLKQLESEKMELERELQQLQTQVDQIVESEAALSRASNTHTRQLTAQYQTLASLEKYHTNALAQLNALLQTNVYNDAFCIGHDGYFGTINGLRLGRSKDRYVEWAEINAALGQIVLLLNMVVVKLGIKLKGYRLKPMGNLSKIEKFEKIVAEGSNGERTNSSSQDNNNNNNDNNMTNNNNTGNNNNNNTSKGGPYKITTLDVFSSGGEYTLERLFNHKRIDTGLVALLDILLQIGTFIEVKDAPVKLPYKIHKDKIGGVSIKLSLSSTYDGWTMACKYLLTNCKWALAHTITRG